MFDDNDIDQDFELSEVEIHKLFIKLHKEIITAKQLCLEIFKGEEEEAEIVSIKIIHDYSFGFEI